MQKTQSQINSYLITSYVVTKPEFSPENFSQYFALQTLSHTTLMHSIFLLKDLQDNRELCSPLLIEIELYGLPWKLTIKPFQNTYCDSIEYVWISSCEQQDIDKIALKHRTTIKELIDENKNK